MKIFLAAGLVAVVALGAHLGWGREALPWQHATGWDQVPAAPAPRETFEIGGETLQLRWLGHSGFLLEWAGTRLLLDAHLGSHCTVAPRRLEPAPSPAALGAIDAALASHAHFDHLDPETLAGLKSLARVILPRGSERYVAELAARGTQVVGLVEGESTRVGELEVIGVAARHNGNRLHPLKSRENALGYIIRHHEATLFFAGDSGYGPHFAAIGERYHPQLAILPIGAFRPAFPLRRYHLSPEEAVAAARDLGVERVVPCHFGTFVLSLDTHDEALPRFAAAARQAGLLWTMPRLFTETG